MSKVAEMRAAVIKAFGGPEVIEMCTIPLPKIRKNEILVKVAVSGINPVDTYLRSGVYPKLPDLPYTPGRDGAGIVAHIGADVKDVKVGERVWFTGSFSGSSAEFATAEHFFHMVPGVSFAQAACLGVPYMTAYRALFTQAQVKTTDLVFVHGASGGVGLAAVQLASWLGIKVVGTAGTKAGTDLVFETGATSAFNHKKEDYIDEIKQLYPNGFDLIMEMAAHTNLDADLGLLKKNGKIAVIGSRGPTTINPRQLMTKQASIFGVGLAHSTNEEFVSMGNAINDFLANSEFRPIIAKEYAVDELPKAHHDIIHTPGATGNIVHVIDSSLI